MHEHGDQRGTEDGGPGDRSTDGHPADPRGDGPAGAREDLLARRFENARPHLRAVAYRMLGSTAEADDAVQEAWLRLSRSDVEGVANLPGWLTTVVGRICLDMLRSRAARREEPYADAADVRLPEPVVAPDDPADPEQQAMVADAVGLALLVVLETLTPAERLAFVLHDMFAVPFEEIAGVVGRTPAATRQLASRARRRVRGTAPSRDTDLAKQRQVVAAFLAASRAGDFDGLLAVLDPDVVLRADYGDAPVHAGISPFLRGAEAVARQALTFRRFAAEPSHVRAVLVNGGPGLLGLVDGRPYSLLAFTVAGGRIVELDIVADPVRLRDITPAGLGE